MNLINLLLDNNLAEAKKIFEERISDKINLAIEEKKKSII